MREIPLDTLKDVAHAARDIPLTDEDAQLFFDLIVCPAFDDLPDVA